MQTLKIYYAPTLPRVYTKVMTNEKWDQLVEQAKQTFEDVTYLTDDLYVETADGEVQQGTQDVLEFSNDHGVFRVVRENKPVVLDKKMHYSHRQGDSARTEYTFSDTEFTHKVRIFALDDDDQWQELDSESLNIFAP